MNQDVDLMRYLERLGDEPPARVRGRVQSLVGMVLRATVPGAALGHQVLVDREGAPQARAQVIGFQGEQVLLMPLDSLEGVKPGSAAVSLGAAPHLWCGEALLGRVLDGLGQPMDRGAPLPRAQMQRWAVHRAPPGPMERARVRTPLATGVRAIDGLMTLGRGQRVGLFAGSGVGKSLLLGQVARACQADVVVICLVGERGRELRAFLEDALGEAGRRRAVVVCATSDAPAMVRRQAPFVATSIAEFFRDQGADVLLLMDSITRLARAQREVGLACGEPPARRGYPPSVFGMLPQLIERAGTAARGSITGLYTALVAGGDMEEPIADELRGLLDGHIVLSRELAQRGHWPAIDPVASLSRLMRQVTDAEHQQAAQEARRVLALHREHRELLALGALRRGANPELEDALELVEELEPFLRQPLDEASALEDTVEALLDITG